MEKKLGPALRTGFERMAPWAGLIDSINVFPVADGDTGTNLVISLGPLKNTDKDFHDLGEKLLASAIGNSGNIAARFFSEFIPAYSSSDLKTAVVKGRNAARKAIYDPKPGTMLDIFNALADHDFKNSGDFHEIFWVLEQAVKKTKDRLSVLKKAGVVDSGALGMFLFFEGFFLSLAKNNTGNFIPPAKRFKGFIDLNPGFKADHSHDYCINALLKSKISKDKAKTKLLSCGKNLVFSGNRDKIKIHIHGNDARKIKKELESMGDLLTWSQEKMKAGETINKKNKNSSERAIHIMTDGAGSLTRARAEKYGITLLDSYIVTEKGPVPETLADSAAVYKAMRKGVKISTAQASGFEKYQRYQSVLSEYKRVLYLCVGSVYTGNYKSAAAWKKKNDPDKRFYVIDTGAASGRLAILAISTAKFAEKSSNIKAIINYAQNAGARAMEFVFIDNLKYLAAGGRMAKSAAFLGNMLNIKPIITPSSKGALKVGIAGTKEDQMAFAIKKLSRFYNKKSCFFMILEYTDNKRWVSENVKKEIKENFPLAKIWVQPLSLTSGVHMGPGTWAIAFMKP